MGTRRSVMMKLISVCVALCAVTFCAAGEPTPVNTGRQVVERLESDWLLVKLEIDEVKKLFTWMENKNMNLTSKLGRCVAVNKKLLNETEELESSLEAMNKTNSDMLMKSKALEKNLARCSKDLDEEVVRCSLLNEQFINETVKADSAISKNALCAQQVKGCDAKIAKLTKDCEDKHDELSKKLSKCEDDVRDGAACCKRIPYLRNETASCESKLDTERKEVKGLTDLVAKACKLSCASTSCGRTPVECEPFCPAPKEGAPRVCGTQRNSSVAGRLEIFNKGTWGTVCDSSFNHVSAGVVCRQMGYTNGYFLGNSVLQNPSSKTGIVLTDVKCNGGEKDIFSCDHVQGPGQCTHAMDVSVSCYNLN